MLFPTPRTQLGEQPYETGRVQAIAIRLNGGSFIFHIFVVYGISKANAGGQPMVQNELLLEQVLTDASTLGDAPVMVIGDLYIY